MIEKNTEGALKLKCSKDSVIQKEGKWLTLG